MSVLDSVSDILSIYYYEWVYFAQLRPPPFFLGGASVADALPRHGRAKRCGSWLLPGSRGPQRLEQGYHPEIAKKCSFRGSKRMEQHGKRMEHEPDLYIWKFLWPIFKPFWCVPAIYSREPPLKRAGHHGEVGEVGIVTPVASRANYIFYLWNIYKLNKTRKLILYVYLKD